MLSKVKVDEGRVGKVLRAAGRLPFWEVGLMVLALWLIKEWYPFSHFPMYSDPDPEADYYFLADEHGDPIPMLTLFNTRTARAKKVYRSYLTNVAEAAGRKRYSATASDKEEAAVRTIRFLFEQARPEQRRLLRTRSLQWVCVDLRFEAGRLSRSRTLLAEWQIPEVRR